MPKTFPFSEYVKHKEIENVSDLSGSIGYTCNMTNRIISEKLLTVVEKLQHVGSSAAGKHVASMRKIDTRNVTLFVRVQEFQ